MASVPAVTAPAADPFAELAPALGPTDALLEADRCLECGGPHAPAPCVVACPADVDVPAFVAAIARGRPETAAEIVFAENVLGATCARVCPVEVLCQSACVLEHEHKRPVPIGRLQRFATERGLAAGVPLRRRVEWNGLVVAVIGAGPAGLAAAGELAARGYDVTVYDERVEIGGLVRYAIAPYRQQREPLSQEMQAIAELGVKFELRHAIDSPDALHAIEEDADAVVLAVGLGDDVDGLPGSELEGVWQSLPFIAGIKTGRPPRVGARVAVIGGGNTAIDVAREAVRLGAREVTMLYRRTRADMPAYAYEVEEAEEEGVRIQFLTAPVRFVGDRHVTGVECRYCRLGEPDDSGRRAPEPIHGTEFVVPVDTAVQAIGQQPRAAFLSWIDGLELRRGKVVVDPETGATGNPKFFAAGDATGGATVVEAVRGAKLAACGVDALLRRSAA